MNLSMTGWGKWAKSFVSTNIILKIGNGSVCESITVAGDRPVQLVIALPLSWIFFPWGNSWSDRIRRFYRRNGELLFALLTFRSMNASMFDGCVSKQKIEPKWWSKGKNTNWIVAAWNTWLLIHSRGLFQNFWFVCCLQDQQEVPEIADQAEFESGEEIEQQTSCERLECDCSAPCNVSSGGSSQDTDDDIPLRPGEIYLGELIDKLAVCQSCWSISRQSVTDCLAVLLQLMGYRLSPDV